MLEIRRMGCKEVHGSDFSIDRRNGYDCYLALFVKTKAVFFYGNRVINIEPNSFIIFNKSSPHRYGADGDRYINDWIQFDTADISSSVPDILFDTPIYIGDSVRVSDYFSLISDLYYRSRDSKAAEHLIKAMLIEVFPKPCGETVTIPHRRALVDLRKRIYRHPEKDWSVDMMAGTVNLSSAYLQEIYKKQFGISCRSDVIRSRIELAQSYLEDTDLGIEEIAYKCGYNSAVHFSRQFGKEVGCPPKEWRKRRKTKST